MYDRHAMIPLPFPRGEGGFFMEENLNEKRLAVLSVIVEDRTQTAALNSYLGDFGEYIVGRMGIPYRERGVAVLCIVLDAPVSAINALTGKIGKLSGVTAKTLFRNI